MTNDVPTVHCSYCNEPITFADAAELLPFVLCKTCQETFLQNRRPEDMDFLAQELQILRDKTDPPLLAALYYLDYERLLQEHEPSIEALCEEHEPDFDAVYMRFSPFFGKIFYQLGMYFFMHGEIQQAYDAINQSISCMNADIYHNGAYDPWDLEAQLAKSFHTLAFLEQQLGNTEQADEWHRVAGAYSHLHKQTAEALLRQIEGDIPANPTAYGSTMNRIAGHYDVLVDRLKEQDPVRGVILRRQSQALLASAVPGSD